MTDLKTGNLKASLLLPMGRLGPSFLVFDNFQAYLKWNSSLVYSTTAAYYATTGFESVGGRRLAELAIRQLGTVGAITVGDAFGQVGPLLRETRMPSIVCSLGPPDAVVAATASLAGALRTAVRAWVAEPLDPNL